MNNIIIIVRKFLLPLGFIVLIGQVAYSQNQFRTRQSGNWNDPNTWEEDTGGGFNTTLNTPTSSSGTITIGNTHSVTISANITIDEVNVENGGIVIVNPTVAVILNNGSGNDLIIDGEFTLQDDGIIDGSVLTVNSGAVVYIADNGTLTNNNPGISKINFSAGSTYQHDRSAGAIPISNWAPTSTCLITGFIETNLSGGLLQSFGNFTWNCVGQTANALLGFTSSTSFAGNFSILNSTDGTTPRAVTLAFTSATIQVAGNVFISGASRLALSLAASTNVTFRVLGDFNFSVTNGTPSSVLGGANVTSELDVRGNFNYTSGEIAKLGSGGTSTITFGGSTAQMYTGGGTAITTPVNFQVNNGSILDLGIYSLTGQGTFTLNAGGTLRVGSTDSGGALQTGAAGNIQTLGRTYNGGASTTIIYNGASAQVIGDGFPADVNLTINNAAGVSLNNDLQINSGRTLILSSGSLTIGSNFTLTINGTFTPNSNFLVGNSSSNLSIGGSGPFGNLALSGPSIKDFTLNRSSSGSVTLVSNLTVVGTYTQNNGDLNLNGNTLRISGPYVKTSGTKIGSSSSSIIIDGSGAFTGTLGIVSPLNTLEINRAGETVNTSSSFTVANLNLLDGALNNGASITMAANGIVTRNSGSLLSNALVATAASTYSVVYTKTSVSALTTGLELPLSTSDLGNLMINCNGPINLNSAITVNETLTLTSGNFNAGSNAIDLKGNLVSNSSSTLTSSAITFSGATSVTGSVAPVFGNVTITGSLTPTSSLNINGNLVNNGTLNSGSATVTFGGTTAISGLSICSFNNLVISPASSLTAPSTTMNVAGTWTNNGTFIGNGGTVVFNGTSSIAGSSATNFDGVTVSGTLTSPSSLNVARDFTNNGTFNAGSGTLVLNGTSTQSITGTTTTTFNNITVTNTAGPPAVRIESNQNLLGVLTLSANSQFDADGNSNSSVFTLLSNSDNTTADASIATLPTGASVIGNVTVQRFMSLEGANSNRIYRYISSPVQSVPVSQIQNSIPVTGGFSGASSCSGCGSSQSMFAYNEALTNGNLSAGYINFPSASNTETLTTGRGYALFVRGNIAPVSSAGNARWSVSGPINSGTVNFNTFTSFTVDGWNLVGNPYPSTIDWDAVGWTRTNVNNALYFLDNGLSTPVYATYISGASVNGGTRYIPTGQAFFVRTSAGGVNFQATESVKAAGTQTTFFRQESVQNELRLALSRPGVRDEAVIRLKDGSTENFDSSYDAVKFKNGTSTNPVISLSSLSKENTDLAINSMGTSFCDGNAKSRVISLIIDGTVPGPHSLSFSQMDTFGEDITFVLRDLLTKDSVILSSSNATYQFDVTTNPKSTGSSRFVLACNCNGRITAINEPIAADVRVFPNPTQSTVQVEIPGVQSEDVKVSMYNNLGSWLGDFEMTDEVNSLKGSFDLSSQANGLYLVRVTIGEKIFTKKVIRK